MGALYKSIFKPILFRLDRWLRLKVAVTLRVTSRDTLDSRMLSRLGSSLRWPDYQKAHHAER